MPGRSFSGTSGYRYGFNGQEKDDETKGEGNSYDFGARIYDPRLGRFFSPDPRERDFAWQSTYVFASNNPIALIDFNGEGSENPISRQVKKEDGSYQGTLVMGDGTTGKKTIEGKTYDIENFAVKLMASISANKKEVGALIVKDKDGNVGILIENSSKNENSTTYHDGSWKYNPDTKKSYVTIEGQAYEVLASIHSHTKKDYKTDYDNIPSYQDQQTSDVTRTPSYLIGPNFVSRIKPGDDNDLTSDFINKKSGGHSEYFKVRIPNNYKMVNSQ